MSGLRNMMKRTSSKLARLLFNNTPSILAVCFLLLCFNACKPAKVSEVKDDNKLTFKFVQLNDVYEIAPLSAGKYGGMARVAHVVDSVRKVNKNTYLFMAGDFLNPSLLGTVKVDGERVLGRQMIEVMNSMNFELATFGNHEFDLGEENLQKRLDESNFYWTSANVFQNNDDGPRSFFFRRNGDTIYVPETYVLEMKDDDGTVIDVGLFGVTLPSNPQDFVHYADINLEAESAYTALQMKQADVIVGLTHLKVSQDIELLNLFPDISLIMGGHEHNNLLMSSKNNGIVAKADANAKTIYIHTITYDLKSKKVEIDSELFPINESVSSNPEVQAIVEKWNAVLDSKIKEVVDNPNEVIFIADPALDGTDTASRSIQTNLGGYITKAMALSFKDPSDAAFVNGGSIRLDDVLDGDVTSLDIFRVLPFGGGVLNIEIKGKLLREVLDYGESRAGTGAYLQRYGFQKAENGEWRVRHQTIIDQKVYRVAVSDFLMKGYDIPFLTPENPGIIKVVRPMETESAIDIRKAVINFFQTINK